MLPRASQIELEAAWDAKKPTKSDNKRSKRRQMQPRSAQERKKCQHGSNRAYGSLGRWHARPPPKVLRSIRSSILKHIGLTRLGTASSAAD